MKYSKFTAGAAAFLAGATILSAAELPYGLPFWKVTPEAKQYIEQLKKKSSYKPMTDRVHAFGRAQVKYALFFNNYLHRWVDRPLHQDTTLSYRAPRGAIITPDTFKIMAADARLGGFDGLSFYPMMSSRMQFHQSSMAAGPVMKVMSEFGNCGSFELEKSKRFEAAEAALKNPNSFKLDGKIVALQYCTYTYHGASEIPRWNYIDQLRKELKEKYGDKFIVMGYTRLYPGSLQPRFRDKQGATDLKHVKAIEERIRVLLRKSDGLHVTMCYSWVEGGRKDVAFYRDVLIPILHSVYSEPEFKGKKYLSLLLDRGHLNMYRWNYFRDSAGTDGLRKTMQILEYMRPDVASASEWDEQNENTSFRPTLYNSISTQRITRSVLQKIAKKPYTPIPGDNVTIPNIIVSTRQSLAVGEALEVEIVNVPDGTFKGEKFQLNCVLKDITGRVVHKFPVRTLDSGVMDEVRYVIPSAKVANSQLLIPCLEVKHKKGVWKSTGTPLAPIEIRGNWNLNYKWIIQPLRNIASGIKADLKLVKKNPDGTVVLKATVKSDKELRNVEIHDCADPVYIDTLVNDYKEDDKNITFHLAFQSIFDHHRKLSGTITLDGVSRAIGKPAMANGRIWQFQRNSLMIWTDKRYVTIPKKDLATAVITIDLKPFFPKTVIKLADIAKKGIYGLSGKQGGLITISRYLSQRAIPAPLMKKETSFTAILRPSDPKTSVFSLVIIDKDFNVYRGNPVSLYKPSGKKVAVRVFDMTTEKPAVAKLDSNLLTTLTYKISPERGAVIATPAGWRYGTVLGGNTPMATNVGQGETSYGNVHLRTIRSRIPAARSAGAVTVPQYFKEADGSYSLKFSGHAHWSLPMQTLAPFCGFELEFKVFPEKLDGKTNLFSMGFNAFELNLKGAVPEAWFFNGDIWKRYAGGRTSNPSFRGPALKLNTWNTVVCRWDGKTCQMIVNGVPGKAVKCVGYVLHAENGGFGGYRSFVGRLKDVVSRPYIVK